MTVSSLSASRLAEALDRRGFAGLGRPLTVRDHTGSTNEDARRAAEQGAAHGTTFVADRQTTGRGRGGHRWHSPPGVNLYASIVLRLDLPLEALAPLSLAAGVAVARCCDEVLASAPGRVPEATVKWPNDVYLGERKVSGILTETSTRNGQSPALILGVGLNVGRQEFPDDLSVSATALSRVGGQDFERHEVGAVLLHHLGEAVRAHAAEGLGAVIGEIRQRDFLRGRRLRVDGRSGTGEGIDERGRLRLRGDDGVVDAVVAGHVAWEGST